MGNLLRLFALALLLQACGTDDKPLLPVKKKSGDGIPESPDALKNDDGDEEDEESSDPASDEDIDLDQTTSVIAGPEPEKPAETTPAPAPAPQPPPQEQIKAPNPQPPRSPQIPPLNKEILDHVRKQLGKKVGNGLCQALETNALAKAKATLGNSFAAVGPGGFALTLVEADKPIFPGDFMHWAGNTNHNNYQMNKNEPQKPKIPGYLSFLILPEGHVSIVSEVISKTEIKVLHQNVNMVKRVREDTIRLDAIVSGKIEFFRAVPKK